MDGLGIATGSGAAPESLLQKVVDRIFRCAHRNRTTPFTPRGEGQTYAVCLDCGKRLPCERPLAQPETLIKEVAPSREAPVATREAPAATKEAAAQESVPGPLLQKPHQATPQPRETASDDSKPRVPARGLASWKYEFLWVGLFVVGLSGGLYWSPKPRHARKPPIPAKAAPALTVAAVLKPSLGLTVERRGSELLLSWDHDSEAIRTATRGTIFVRAGDAGWEIALTGDQLHSRRAVATPTAKEVDLKLQVVNAAEVVTEDSIVVSSPKPPSEVSSAVSAAPAASRSAAPQPKSAHSDAPPPSANSVAADERPRLEGKDSVVVLGRDAQAAIELSRHPDRLDHLIESGSLFTVARGTAITVLQTERRVVKVHVAEGSMTGQEGWAQASQVTSRPKSPEPVAEKQSF